MFQDPRDNIHFKRCTHLSFAWSGVMRSPPSLLLTPHLTRIDPGHRLPLHRHAPSEVYYILEVRRCHLVRTMHVHHQFNLWSHHVSSQDPA